MLEYRAPSPGGEVVTQRSAKPRYAGSIPAQDSMKPGCLQTVFREAWEPGWSNR